MIPPQPHHPAQMPRPASARRAQPPVRPARGAKRPIRWRRRSFPQGLPRYIPLYIKGKNVAEKPSARQPTAQKSCKISDGKIHPNQCGHSPPRCAACCKMIRCLAAHAATRSAPRPEFPLSILPLASLHSFALRHLPPLRCTTSLCQILSHFAACPAQLHCHRPSALFRSLTESPHCRPLSPHAAILPRAKIHLPLAPPHPKVQTCPSPPKKPERRCAAAQGAPCRL